MGIPAVSAVVAMVSYAGQNAACGGPHLTKLSGYA
jgi:hypothetical protein